MAKKKASEPAIRKSFLVTGGIAVGAAVFGFVLMTFVFGGGGGGDDSASEITTLNGASIPIASAAPAPGSDDAVANELTPGGRDPFISRAPASSSSSTTSATSGAPAPVAAPAPAPVTYVPPAPVAQAPQGEGPAPAPAPQPAAPEPTPRPVYERQTITVMSVYKRSADIRIDDTVYEGARAKDVLTERFNLDGFSQGCLYMKDMFPADSQSPERFKLCENDTVTR